MSKSVINGGALEVPGSTAQGLLDRPLEEFALVLPGRAIDGERVLIEGDLDALAEQLYLLRQEVLGRAAMVRVAEVCGTTVVVSDGLALTVPDTLEVMGASTEALLRMAVRVDEDPPSGL